MRNNLVYRTSTIPTMAQRPIGCSSIDVHRALFPKKRPTRHSLRDLKNGVRAYIRKKHGVLMPRRIDHSEGPEGGRSR
jgi:hypothetical protein